MQDQIGQRLIDYYRDRGRKFGVDAAKIESRVAAFVEGQQAENFLARIEEFVPELDKINILDVGSGPGRLVRPLHQKGYEVRGLEYDPTLVEMGNLWIGKELIFPGTAYELPFANNSFDIVVGHDLLEHLQDPHKVVHEMCRVCKPGGYLYIVTPNRLYPREPHYSIYPFPSCLPKAVGSMYLRLRGRNPEFFDKDVWPITYWKVRKMVQSYCPDFVCLEDRGAKWVWRKNLLAAATNVFKHWFKLHASITVIARKPYPDSDYHYSYEKVI